MTHVTDFCISTVTRARARVHGDFPKTCHMRHRAFEGKLRDVAGGGVAEWSLRHPHGLTKPASVGVVPVMALHSETPLAPSAWAAEAGRTTTPRGRGKSLCCTAPRAVVLDKHSETKTFIHEDQR